MASDCTEESTQFTLTFTHSFTHAHIYRGQQVLKALCRCYDWMSQPCLFANIDTNCCLLAEGCLSLCCSNWH